MACLTSMLAALCLLVSSCPEDRNLFDQVMSISTSSSYSFKENKEFDDVAQIFLAKLDKDCAHFTRLGTSYLYFNNRDINNLRTSVDDDHEAVENLTQLHNIFARAVILDSEIFLETSIVVN
ncbi:hypothetical protein M0R45_032710 [Rubus argutus]|uniref:Uncharacterized protein n=1 Tax=Rubus argutus TaxID=59490 RepID=A0AAW1WJI1_RUBAR